MLPIIIGTLGLAAEYGNATVVRAGNQRIADAAAVAAAIAYDATGTLAGAQAAAIRVSSINDFVGNTVTADIVASPADAARSAVRVRLRQAVPMGLSSFFKASVRDTQVVSTSVAELISQASNCILALDAASTGIDLSGGTGITANACGIGSNARLQVANCGITI